MTPQTLSRVCGARTPLFVRRARGAPPVTLQALSPTPAGFAEPENRCLRAAAWPGAWRVVSNPATLRLTLAGSAVLVACSPDQGGAGRAPKRRRALGAPRATLPP